MSQPEHGPVVERAMHGNAGGGGQEAGAKEGPA